MAAAAPLDSIRFLVEAHHWSDVSARKSEDKFTGVTIGEKVSLEVSITVPCLNFLLISFFWFSTTAEARLS